MVFVTFAVRLLCILALIEADLLLHETDLIRPLAAAAAALMDAVRREKWFDWWITHGYSCWRVHRYSNFDHRVEIAHCIPEWQDGGLHGSARPHCQFLCCKVLPSRALWAHIEKVLYAIFHEEVPHLML